MPEAPAAWIYCMLGAPMILLDLTMMPCLYRAAVGPSTEPDQKRSATSGGLTLQGLQRVARDIRGLVCTRVNIYTYGDIIGSYTKT